MYNLLSLRVQIEYLLPQNLMVLQQYQQKDAFWLFYLSILVEMSLKMSHLASSATFCILYGIVWTLHTVVVNLLQCAEKTQRRYHSGSEQKNCSATFCRNNDKNVFFYKFFQIGQSTIVSEPEVVCKLAGYSVMQSAQYGGQLQRKNPREILY